jgi:hypothetical protein
MIVGAVVQPYDTYENTRKKKTIIAYIDVTATYERILKKGYKSVDMFKRVANARFFEGDLVAAAKWYAELFAMTTDFEDVFYYRYAKSLTAINEHKKAAEMMAIFESKNQKE